VRDSGDNRQKRTIKGAHACRGGLIEFRADANKEEMLNNPIFKKTPEI